METKSKFTEKANLCQCNNCGGVFIDQNSQIGAKQFLVDFSKVSELQYISAEDDMTDPQAKKSEIDGNEYFWGCGVCETDGYLTDEIDETKAKNLGIID